MAIKGKTRVGLAQEGHGFTTQQLLAGPYPEGMKKTKIAQLRLKLMSARFGA
jgi:hypothetical protein